MIGSLAALAGLEVRETARRHVKVMLLVALAGVFVIGASAYGLSALSVLLAQKYGSMNADLMVGAALLVMALLVTLTAWVVYARPRSRESKAALVLAAAPLALGVGRRLAPSLLKTAPLILIVGLLAGRALASRE